MTAPGKYKDQSSGYNIWSGPTDIYVNAAVSLVCYYGVVVCMKKRELPQDPTAP